MFELAEIAWLAWTDDARVWFIAGRTVDSSLHSAPLMLLRVFFIEPRVAVAAIPAVAPVDGMPDFAERALTGVDFAIARSTPALRRGAPEAK